MDDVNIHNDLNYNETCSKEDDFQVEFAAVDSVASTSRRVCVVDTI